MAYDITIANPSEPKWKQLGDLALLSGNLVLAEVRPNPNPNPNPILNPNPNPNTLTP